MGNTIDMESGFEKPIECDEPNETVVLRKLEMEKQQIQNISSQDRSVDQTRCLKSLQNKISRLKKKVQASLSEDQQAEGRPNKKSKESVADPIKDDEAVLFQQLEQEKQQLLNILVQDRSANQKSRLKYLQGKISQLKKKLNCKKQPLSEEERQAKKRVYMASAENLEATRLRMASAKNLEADRLRKKSAENLEAGRLRMASAENLEADRIRKKSAENLEAARVRMASAQNREANRVRKTGDRQFKKSSNFAKPFDACTMQDIHLGVQIVPCIHNTSDSIGAMNIPCKHCGALKWKTETASSCCCDGKVYLPPVPDPPTSIMNLWYEQSERAKLFREQSRSMNNALCLSSIKVNERRLTGYNPSVVFEGKMFQYCGSIQHEPGEIPKFCQLYVMDPSLSEAQRINNLILPQSVTPVQRTILEDLLKILQADIKACNPFVKDFLTISELPDDQCIQGKIVICAKAPTGEHERRYNEQICLEEVRILTNNSPHDLVLFKRGGGLHTVSDQNPSAFPLHFTLLFPLGTKGWDQTNTHTDGKKRLTVREFYAFRTNVRDKARDYIFQAGRLFQEYLCMAWTTTENQQLNYHAQNQKALRADTYKNVQELVADRQRVPLTDQMGGDVRPGRRIVLASSFTGGPRWFNAKLQNGMAICREFHKPDLFLTMTCNPMWPEIVSELSPGQTAHDRPDLVARVFNLKKDAFLEDIITRGIFGKVPAYMWVIEWQVRIKLFEG